MQHHHAAAAAAAAAVEGVAEGAGQDVQDGPSGSGSPGSGSAQRDARRLGDEIKALRDEVKRLKSKKGKLKEIAPPFYEASGRFTVCRAPLWAYKTRA
jgi:hypothetical protein